MKVFDVENTLGYNIIIQKGNPIFDTTVYIQCCELLTNSEQLLSWLIYFTIAVHFNALTILMNLCCILIDRGIVYLIDLYKLTHNIQMSTDYTELTVFLRLTGQYSIAKPCKYLSPALSHLFGNPDISHF